MRVATLIGITWIVIPMSGDGCSKTCAELYAEELEACESFGGHLVHWQCIEDGQGVIHVESVCQSAPGTIGIVLDGGL